MWWGRRLAQEQTGADVGKGFVEVMPSDKTFAAKLPVAKAVAVLSAPTVHEGMMDVILRSGRILRIKTGGDVAALRALLGVLEEA
jgi:hypothetical protein